MSSNQLLNLDDDEKRRWGEIWEFDFPHATRRRQITYFFWKKTVEAFNQGNFICSSMLAGITAELAQKTRLLEEEIVDENDEYLRQIVKDIKECRNMWVQPDLDEIEAYAKGRGSSLWSDATMNVAFVSTDLKPVDLTKALLTRLFVETTPKPRRAEITHGGLVIPIPKGTGTLPSPFIY